MLTGARADPEQVRALEGYFVLLADHGMNASTFALRVVLSTQADLVAAATAPSPRCRGRCMEARVAGQRHAGCDRAPEAAAPGSTAPSPGTSASWGSGIGLQDRRPARRPIEADGRAVADPVDSPSRSPSSASRWRRSDAHDRDSDSTRTSILGAVVLERPAPARAVHADVRAGADGRLGRARLEQAADNRLIRPDVLYRDPDRPSWPAGLR